jgi:hypothetical protein
MHGGCEQLRRLGLKHIDRLDGPDRCEPLFAKVKAALPLTGDGWRQDWFDESLQVAHPAVVAVAADDPRLFFERLFLPRLLFDTVNHPVVHDWIVRGQDCAQPVRQQMLPTVCWFPAEDAGCPAHVGELMWELVSRHLTTGICQVPLHHATGQPPPTASSTVLDLRVHADAVPAGVSRRRRLPGASVAHPPLTGRRTCPLPALRLPSRLQALRDQAAAPVVDLHRLRAPPPSHGRDDLPSLPRPRSSFGSTSCTSWRARDAAYPPNS